MKPYKRKTFHWERFFSIKNALVLPIVVVFAVYFSISMFYNIQNATMLVSNFLEVHSLAISNNIRYQLDDFFNEAISNVKENTYLIESGILEIDDRETLSKHFLSQLKNNPFMTYISIGFANGEYIGAGRMVDSGEMRLFESTQENGGFLNEFEVDSVYNKIGLSKKGIPFNATTREWYKSAEASGEVVWYPVYKYAAQEALGIGVSAPLYDATSGELLGVLTADLALNQISSFLKTLDYGANGIVFVAEEDGHLIGISEDVPLYREEGGAFERTDIFEAPNSVLHEAVSDEGRHDDSKIFELDKLKYHYNHIHYDKIKDQAFFIGVVLSYEDFSNNYQWLLYKYAFVAMIILLVLGLCLVAILRVFIVPPINRLMEGYERVKTGDYSHSIIVKGNYEAKVLTEGFNDMMAFLEKSKKMEREYIALEKFATLGAMVSGVTHEINTPLGLSITMGSHLEALHKQVMTHYASGQMTKQAFTQYLADLEEAIQILNRNLYRASELVTSFKALSVGQSSEQEVLFSMCELIDYAIVSLKHAYKKGNHKIEVQCDNDVKLFGYPGAWTQILTNLIMNSIIHGFHNRTNGIIHIRFYRLDHTFILAYEDDGCGMSPDVKDKVFQPFFTTNRENGGTGIGMSIVYELVTHKLHGTIELSSAEEEGVLFTIKVPDSEVLG